MQIAYVSRASSVLAPDDVFKIIETSARNNSRDDLTGFLIFAENRFFQVVEGSRSAIDALLSSPYNIAQVLSYDGGGNDGAISMDVTIPGSMLKGRYLSYVCSYNIQ